MDGPSVADTDVPQGDPPASTAEPALPRRDSYEDANSSLTRKRPRLDSGGGRARSMSPEPTSTALDERGERPRIHYPDGTASEPLPGDSTSSSPSRSNQVTMTVRTQQGSPMDLSDSVEGLANNGNPTKPVEVVDVDVEVVAQKAKEDVRTDSPLSPKRASPIEIEADEPEVMEGFIDANYIQISGDEGTLASDILDRFPYLDRFRDCSEAARALANHVEREEHLMPNYFNLLAEWFETQVTVLGEHGTDWDELYLNERDLWEQIATIFIKLFTRRVHFGSRLTIPDVESGLVRLLQSYVKIVARLIETDVILIRETPADSVQKPLLFSPRHLKALFYLHHEQEELVLRDVLEREYRIPVDMVIQKAVLSFLEDGTDGLKHMANFAHECLLRIYTCPAYNFNVLSVLRFADEIEPFGSRLSRLPSFSGEPTGSAYPARAYAFFRAVHNNVSGSTHKLPSSATPELRRLLYIVPGKLLHAATSMSKDIAVQVYNEFVGIPDACDERDQGIVATYFWKIRFLKEYICRGKMDIRVFGIETMSSDLVDFYRSEGDSGRAKEPPMQLLAQLLLDERIIEYIVGVDSHPQLIQRSSNILGFLIVTTKYTTEMADTVWQTLTKSQDPRVVAAMVEMLTVSGSLMQAPELLYLFSKYNELPSDEFQADILAFLSRLCQMLIPLQKDWVQDPSRMVPFNLAVRLLQDSSAQDCSLKNYRELHEDATRVVCSLARGTRKEFRLELYSNFANRLRQSEKGATGELQALCLIARQFKTEYTYLTAELGLSSLLLKHLRTFQDHVLERSNGTAPGPMQAQIMKHGLNLLLSLLLHDSDSLPEEEYSDLRKMLFSSGPLIDEAREQVWARLAEIARHASGVHPFIDRCIKDLLNSLPPALFTGGAFDFVFQSANYTLRVAPEPRRLESGVLTVPCEGILWRIVLLAHDQGIAENAIRFLGRMYLNTQQMRHVSKEEVEAMHVSIVNRCLTVLLEMCGRDGSMADFEHTAMPFDVPIAENPTQSFSRAIQFLGIWLHQVRTNNEFASAPLPAPTAGKVNDELVGDPVTFSYQAFADNSSPEIHTAQVGDLETRRDFIQRLAKLTGFSTFQLICAGQREELGAFPTQTLREWGILRKGLLLIKKTADAPAIIEPNAPIGVYSSAIEAEICSQLKSFYRFLEAADPIAGATYLFLRKFVPTESACVETIHASPSEAFVHGKPYKIRYSLLCVEAHLNRQKCQGAIDQTFVKHAIELLLRFILDLPQSSKSISNADQIEQLCQVSTLCLRLTSEFKPDSDLAIKIDDADQITLIILHTIKALLASPRELADMAAYNFYTFLLHTVKFTADIWSAFAAAPMAHELHYLLLVQDPRTALRSAVAKVIKMVSEQPFAHARVEVRAIARFFWETALAIIPRTVRAPETATDFYTLTSEMFTLIVHKYPDVIDDASLSHHIDTWRTILMDHKHEEVVGRDDPDIIIFGLSTLISFGIQCLKQPSNPVRDRELMEHLFSTFLFPPASRFEEVDEGKPIEIKQPVLESSTRMVLYQLLTTLALEHDQFARLVTLAEGALLPEESRYYLYDRPRTLRSSTGHVGIRNLGNTCYMNSLLTQLFMNLQFRRFMLSLPTSASQNLLEETQKLFSNMQNSYIKAVHAGDLAKCIRTYDDAQIDVAIQMDVEEFFNLLFDQWEGQMDSPANKQQFRSFFGGQIVNQIKSKECEHISERSESFIAVQCDVKGKGNLHESLQAYVEGDVMEGENKYKCESCGGKFVDAVKRSCLKEVPDNVIFHLKRFDFDLGLMQRNKINDLFEFPMTIDLSPYKVEHLNYLERPSEPDIFELVGVLLHKGVAEHGHYFSYIRTRHTGPDVQPEWLQFDDSDVTVFNPAEIREKCFGGMSDAKDSQFGADFHTPMLKGYNAYMLFYQRASSIKRDQEEWRGLCGSVPPQVSVPPVLERQIARENELIIREYCMFDPNHAAFIKFLLDRLGTDVPHDEDPGTHGLRMQIIELVVSNLHQVFGRSKETRIFEEMVGLFKDRLGDCAVCSALTLNAFLKDRNGTYALTDLLFRSGLPKVRLVVRLLVLGLLNTLREVDPICYGLPPDDVSPLVSEQGILPMVVQALQTSLSALFWNTRAWEDVFGLLCDISKMGSYETGVILSTGVFSTCFDLLVAQMEYPAGEDLERLVRCMERRNPPQHRLFELFCHVLTQIDLDADAAPNEFNQAQDFDPQTGKFPPTVSDLERIRIWDPKDRALVFFNRMLDKWDGSRGEEFFVGDIVPYLLDTPAGLGLGDLVFATLHEGIEQVAHAYVAPYLLAGVRFCESSRDPLRIFDIVSAAGRSANTLEAEGGEVHIRFFSEARKVENVHLRGTEDARMPLVAVLELCPGWACRLLAYPDAGVREETGQVLAELLYETPAAPEIVEDPESGAARVDPMFVRRLSKARELLKSLLHRAQTALSSEAFSKRGMAEMVEAMTGLATWLHLVHQTVAGIGEEGMELAAQVGKFRSDDDVLVERSLHCASIFDNWPNSDEQEEIQSDTAECWGVSDMSGESDDGVEVEP